MLKLANTPGAPQLAGRVPTMALLDRFLQDREHAAHMSSSSGKCPDGQQRGASPICEQADCCNKRGKHGHDVQYTERKCWEGGTHNVCSVVKLLRTSGNVPVRPAPFKFLQFHFIVHRLVWQKSDHC